MDIESKISSQCIFFLCKSLGYEVSINHLPRKPNVYSLNITKGHQQDNQNRIKKIFNLGASEQYVYDLETENHHFQAGIGQQIVHNTEVTKMTLPALCMCATLQQHPANSPMTLPPHRLFGSILYGDPPGTSAEDIKAGARKRAQRVPVLGGGTRGCWRLQVFCLHAILLLGDLRNVCASVRRGVLRC